MFAALTAPAPAYLCMFKGLSDKKLQLIYGYVNYKNMIYYILLVIIIEKGWQCRAGRERLTPYQSEDPCPQYQPIEWMTRKGKQQETKT